MDARLVSSNFQEALSLLFAHDRTVLSAREDSRAFGAMVQERVEDNWLLVTTNLGPVSHPKPGRRTIYDFACTIEGELFGFDIKTKDLDSEKYSDGGVCAVDNLLKFMANQKGTLMIIEVGHRLGESEHRSLKYIAVAPLHCLPFSEYRIENLGTGQVRFNSSLKDVVDSIDWGRTKEAFFEYFSELAIKHYNTVAANVSPSDNSS